MRSLEQSVWSAREGGDAGSQCDELKKTLQWTWEELKEDDDLLYACSSRVPFWCWKIIGFWDAANWTTPAILRARSGRAMSSSVGGPLKSSNSSGSLVLKSRNRTLPIHSFFRDNLTFLIPIMVQRVLGDAVNPCSRLPHHVKTYSHWFRISSLPTYNFDRCTSW